MALAWRVVPGQSLLHRSWDGQAVLYNDVSGSTHLLDEATLALLHALRAGEVLAEELADPELQPTLEALQKLHLVEPC